MLAGVDAVLFAVTVMFFDAVAGPQEPPLLVKVKVAVPLNPAGGVQVAFKLVALGLKVPPAFEDQVPPVAEPPTLPPKAAEVPPWQMAGRAAPTLTVGAGVTVIFKTLVVLPQEFDAVIV